MNAFGNFIYRAFIQSMKKNTIFTFLFISADFDDILKHLT